MTKANRTCAIAAATAHSLNNDLTVILSSVEESILRLEPGHPARQFLVDASDACSRSAGLAKSLLVYSARGGSRPNPVSLRSLLS